MVEDQAISLQDEAAVAVDHQVKAAEVQVAEAAEAAEAADLQAAEIDK